MDKDNYEKGFRLTFENAQRLFTAAETLEVNKEFIHISNSLMILAAEEAMKAYTILTQHFFPEKPVEDFNKFFEDHKHKLDTIRSIIGIKQIYQIFDEYWRNPILENLDKSTDELAKIKSDGIANIVKRLNIEADSNKTDMALQNKWWQHAQTMKENGFYVGYNKGSGAWADPVSIKKENYVKTKKYVSEFIESVSMLYKVDLADENVADIVNEVKTTINETKKKYGKT